MSPAAPSDPSLDFSDIPPFPSDVKTAPLLRLSLQKLLDKDAEESSRLWDACRDVGFFYLDLRNARGIVDVSATSGEQANGNAEGHVNGNTNGHADGFANGCSGVDVDGDKFLGDAARLFGTAEEFYDLPVEEKVMYDFKERNSYHGYKGYGAGVIDKAGNKDRNEFYNISKDDILGLEDPLPAPTLLNNHRPTLESYIKTSHTIVTLVLQHLNTHLHLAPGTLPSLHPLHAKSGDQVRFVKAPPQPPQDSRAALGAHSDFGSVTVLFNRLGGLQILPPATDGLGLDDAARAPYWEYVRPLRGHCVINLGDAMVKFSAGVLRSNIHRVVNPPGGQAGFTRYSLVYFNRPQEDVLLRRLEGSDVIDAAGAPDAEEEVITSKEWILRRALGRRTGGDFAKSEGTEAVRGAAQKA